MKFLLVTLGSTGDVHPYAAIGRELQRRGHQVVLITSVYFEDLARKAGVNFCGLGTVEQYLRITGDPELWHPRTAFAKYSKLFAQDVGPRLYQGIEEHHEPGKTVIVAGGGTFAARFFQEKYGTPLVTLCLAPQALRSVIAPPLIPGLPDLRRMPRRWRRAMFWMVDRFFIDRWLREPLNCFRANVGLGPITGRVVKWWESPTRIIGLWPAWFAPPASDWPQQVRLTDFPLYDGNDAEELAPDLDDFLSAGDPPIVFTPGSPMQHSQFFFDAAVAACRRLRRRGILLTRHTPQLPSRLPDNVRHFSYAPFSKLLPRAAGLVYHGGVGTLAQALAAGIPQVVIPTYYDQPDNGLRMSQLGVGRVIPLKLFNENVLTAQLRDVLGSRKIAEACRRCVPRMFNTNAIPATCDLIEDVARNIGGNGKPREDVTAQPSR